MFSIDSIFNPAAVISLTSVLIDDSCPPLRQETLIFGISLEIYGISRIDVFPHKVNLSVNKL